MFVPGSFFTLTELQERLGINDRQNIRDALIPKGAPHVVLGRETFFAVDSFVAWLRSKESAMPPKRKG